MFPTIFTQPSILFLRRTYTIHHVCGKNIPKGFSCGVVARPDERCGVNDIVVPVDCDKSVLKVAKNWCDGESIVNGECNLKLSLDDVFNID